MAYSADRVKKQRQWFQQIVGVQSDDLDLRSRDLKLKSQAFWVTNRDQEGACGHVCLGHVVEDQIEDDKYDFIHLGRNGSPEMKEKLEKFTKEQEAAIFDGHIKSLTLRGYGLEDAHVKAGELLGSVPPPVDPPVDFKGKKEKNPPDGPTAA
jgi:hypothetical protein